MFTEELLQESRQSADRAKKNLEHITNQPTGMTGGGSAAGHTVTRTAMRKNEDHISKSIHIDKILAIIAKETGKSSEQYGIIPHPLAWDICFDEDTVYAHTIDGPEVECAFDNPENKEEKLYCVHRLSVEGATLISQDTDVAISSAKNQILIPIIVALVIVLFFSALIIPSLI